MSDIESCDWESIILDLDSCDWETDSCDFESLNSDLDSDDCHEPIDYSCDNDRFLNCTTTRNVQHTLSTSLYIQSVYVLCHIINTQNKKLML